MALTGNKGEWSEVYTHFRLLGDGYLYPADDKGKQAKELGSPIVQIMRKEDREDEDNLFIIDRVKKNILFKGKTKELTVSQESFEKLADILLDKIKSSRSEKEQISIEEIENAMTGFEMRKLKAKPIDKADIRMVLHCIKSNIDTKQGFSIKSKLGGQSTLFNSNKNGTNLLFEITGGITDGQLDELNSMSDTKEKRRRGFFGKWFNKLDEWGYKVEYRKVLDDTFACNLQFVDITFDKVMAESLLAYYSHKAASSKMTDVISHVMNLNPCGVNELIRPMWYIATMKRFLIYYALGMTANKMWDNKMQANGGYIVVREDGDIVTYHFYDVTQLGNYLFENTAFDTPSTSRHLFNQVYRDKEDGKAYMKLNPQIRFIHAK